jgi:hypothetical protein
VESGFSGEFVSPRRLWRQMERKTYMLSKTFKRTGDVPFPQD